MLSFFISKNYILNTSCSVILKYHTYPDGKEVTMMSLDVERNLDMTYKLTNLFLSGTTTLLEVIKTTFDYMDKDPAANILKKYMKNGGQLDFSVCQKEYANELAERMADEGIVFLRSGNMAKGGVTMFVYAETDCKRVEKVLNEFRAEHSRDGVTDHATLYAYANGNTRKLQGLDYCEAARLTEYAEKSGMKIVVEEPKTGEFNVLYAEHDRGRMNRIRADIAIEFSGIAGEALRKQLLYESTKATRMIDLVSNYTKEESTYLVDIKGQQMCITENGAVFKGENGEITVDRFENNYAERCTELIMEMKNPVQLTEEEKQEYENEINKKKFLTKADLSQGRPAYSAEEYKSIREMMAKKEVYEMKLAMAEPDQAVYDIDLENDDMRLATFEEFNEINEEIANTIDREIDTELMKEIQRKNRSYIDNPQILDFEAVDLENQILDGNIHDHEYDKDVMDLMHDKNNNLIPDEYEK